MNNQRSLYGLSLHQNAQPGYAFKLALGFGELRFFTYSSASHERDSRLVVLVCERKSTTRLARIKDGRGPSISQPMATKEENPSEGVVLEL